MQRTDEIYETTDKLNQMNLLMFACEGHATNTANRIVGTDNITDKFVEKKNLRKKRQFQSACNVVDGL